MMKCNGKSGRVKMEYRHKMKRSAVSLVIDKAIKNIQVDPRRTIRNLVDMGECFSTTPAQKNFFDLAGEVLKNKDNPYYKLLLNLVYNVNAETVKTISLNFGYTALNYGSQIIRKNEAVLKKRIPWLLCFDFNTKYRDINTLEWTKSVIDDAVSLGIYTFVFRLCDFTEYFNDVLEICKKHRECCFFTAISPLLLSKEQLEQVAKVRNLILSVNVTNKNEVQCSKELLKLLHDYKCFYGFNTYYTNANADYIMSEEFTQEMIDCGCFFGGFINKNIEKKELEKRIYRHVCSARGKNGKPIFLFDFFTDAKYISNSIFSAPDLYISDKGEAKMAGGIFANLHSVTLSELAKTSKFKFAD